MFLAGIFREDRPVMDLLDANYTFVNERVARHYGIEGVYGPRLPPRADHRREPPRHCSVKRASLAVTSHTTRTSPVVRGKWILSNLLGTPPPPPPPDVPALKENTAGVKPTSVRERLELHRENPACASCHKIMDPLGFALENFDATGRWRTTDAGGTKIDTVRACYWDGIPVDGPVVSAQSPARTNPTSSRTTFSDKLMTYALGRGLDYNDMPALRAVVKQAGNQQYKFSSIVLGIVKSVPFQMKGGAPVLGAQRGKEESRNFISKKSLDRRTLPRGRHGCGVLPPCWTGDGLAALTAQTKTAAAGAPRLGSSISRTAP